jgi:hypothetical protein
MGVHERLERLLRAPSPSRRAMGTYKGRGEGDTCVKREAREEERGLRSNR